MLINQRHFVEKLDLISRPFLEPINSVHEAINTRLLMRITTTTITILIIIIIIIGMLLGFFIVKKS
jgi:heme/copper-type cytochrome/quinol oxidase subunit 2